MGTKSRALIKPLPDNYQIDSPIGGAKRNDDTKLEDESLLDNNNSTAADTNIPDFVSKDVLLSPLYWSTGLNRNWNQIFLLDF